MDWLDGCTVIEVNWHPGSVRAGINEGLRIRLSTVRFPTHPISKILLDSGMEVLRAVEDNITDVKYLDELQEEHIYKALEFKKTRTAKKVIDRVIRWLVQYRISFRMAVRSNAMNSGTIKGT